MLISSSEDVYCIFIIFLLTSPLISLPPEKKYYVEIEKYQTLDFPLVLGCIFFFQSRTIYQERRDDEETYLK